jgi:sugar phosphate isomerase/epimerase
MTHRYRYPLSFQTVLPDDYQGNRSFCSLLDLLHELGFWGLEVNIGDPKAFDGGAVRRFLEPFHLELSMLATGRTALQLGLSLSHPDENVRQRSVEKCREMIDRIGGSGTGMIIGLLKGGPWSEPEKARRRFALSLEEIIPAARACGVPVLVEATNRYETAIANTVAEAADLVGKYGSECAQVLPDTFHMNIEEKDMLGTLRAHRDRFTSLHLSDNNRRFPGFGEIDFGRLIAGLAGFGYKGRLAIEGNARGDLRGDLKATINYLAPLLEEKELRT